MIMLRTIWVPVFVLGSCGLAVTGCGGEEQQTESPTSIEDKLKDADPAVQNEGLDAADDEFGAGS